MTRNQLLAVAAGVGVVSALLAVAANSIVLSEEWGIFAFRAEFGFADVAAVVSEVLGLVAFTFVALGFLRAARPARLQALVVGAWLFAGYGLVAAAASIIRTVGAYGEPWKWTAGGAAEAAGNLAVAVAAGIAAFAFSGVRDWLLARAAAVLAIAYALFAASYAFILSGYLGNSVDPYPAVDRVTWAISLIAGGRFVAVLGAVVAAVALSAGAARRAGLFGAGAIVFAAGIVIEGVGFLLFASGGSRASGWLESASVLVLAAAAFVAGVAFFSGGRSEQSDSPDFAVLPDTV